MNNSIYVNMTPNPLDLQQLSCSQGDTSSRKFQFTLHNQGEVYDLSNISDPVFTSFPVSAGGTEELLPTNTGTPATSPIVADIRYPDGLRQEESFTYRESPTTLDGNAKVKALYGNSLAWNQLVDTNTSSVTLTSGHKFITKVGGTYSLVNGTGQSLSVTGGTDEVFDLTKMGLDSITSADEFTSLFPLSYYSYNSGSLLSFNGTGIKTVGFNQWDEEWQLGNINVTTGAHEYTNDMFCSRNFIPVLPETDYFMMNPTPSTLKTRFYDAGMNYIGSNDYNGTGSIPVGGRVFKTPSNCCYFKFATQSGVDVYNNNICLNISNLARNGEYEAYTEKTSDLPTLTYFPNGMKSAGSVYDELTESKAITRIGVIDLGTLNWRHRGEVGQGIFSCDVTSDIPYKRQPSVNFEVATYENGGTVTGVSAMTEKNNMSVALYYSADNTSCFIYAKNTAYTDGAAFKNAMSGVLLNYELATSSEESIMSATLVTENGEAPLYHNGDVLECECNSDISKEAGFFDAKIGFTDSDGTNYSNKIQLHVERSPQ